MMSNTKTLLGFVAGTMAGAAIAVLFAPASGRETRKDLLGVTDDSNAETGTAQTAGSGAQAGEEKIRSVMHHAKEYVASDIS